MAGGPSTPALVAAVSEAGGLGFLAAGYRSAQQLAADIAATRARTTSPFGVNVFVPSAAMVDGVDGVDADAVAAYRRSLEPEAERLGVELGEPRDDDDDWKAKLELLAGSPVPVVSFTFGCPDPAVVADLHRGGSAVLVTVTTPAEARAAAEAGADGLVAQGVEAGGHRGGFTDIDGVGDYGLLALLRLLAGEVEVPLVAAGGIADGAGIAAVLAAGASAAQLGTAFLRCPEAGTNAIHRAALAGIGDTTLTRAFTGRRARAITNRFVTEHGRAAPSAYPHISHVTAPLRAAARQADDAATLHLWAGQTYPLTAELPAGRLVARLARDLDSTLDRLCSPGRRHGGDRSR